MCQTNIRMHSIFYILWYKSERHKNVSSGSAYVFEHANTEDTGYVLELSPNPTPSSFPCFPPPSFFCSSALPNVTLIHEEEQKEKEEEGDFFTIPWEGAKSLPPPLFFSFSISHVGNTRERSFVQTGKRGRGHVV